MHTLPRRIHSFLAPTLAASIGSSAIAGDCNSANGPDVIVADLAGFSKWGTLSGISAYSFGTVSCNLGDQVLPWIANANQHPVIAQNLYRLKNGRFEQLGMSWLKHGWGAATDDFCCLCINPQDFEALGIGCSDPYGASLNGDQDGIPSGKSCVAGLGPRSQVNASNGAFPYPAALQCATGSAIFKRIQVPIDDLNPALNAGALYFAEGHYVTPHDAAAGNGNNNASYRPFTVGSLTNGSYTLSFSPAFPTQQQQPAIHAWQAQDPGVNIELIDIPDDGRLILGYRATDNGNGTWHYEYALYNMNSDRSAQVFSIPIPPGVSVTNAGFHDVDYHSGDGEVIGTNYSATDWPDQLGDGSISWATEAYTDNSNANALRWGTLYNFRFDADAPPVAVTAFIGLFKPGTPSGAFAQTIGPAKLGDINADGVVNVEDLLLVISAWGPCPPPPATCPADIEPSGGNGVVNIGDLLLLIGNWG
ncbi:MAG: hypothetical protein L0Y44_11245 [Phycisphaerales bacterium]|nr:hypothetical protein [Phycisphaerales bacterium]MCI0675076.1 hypothetical protein [Phycisphaerales bacterium]